MQSLPLYTSYLFSMLLNYDITDFEKPDEICLLTFVVDEFSKKKNFFTSINLFYYTFKIAINNK